MLLVPLCGVGSTAAEVMTTGQGETPPLHLRTHYRSPASRTSQRKKQDKSLLKTPAHGSSGSPSVPDSTLLTCPPLSCGASLWQLQSILRGGYILLHHSHRTLGHRPHHASGLGTAVMVRASQEAPRLLPPSHHPPQKPKCGRLQRQ